MKIVELLNKVHIPITNEESDVLGKFGDNNTIEKSELNLRETILANNLVNKSILSRKKKNGKIYFKKRV